ncbi:MAG: monovalent cation/H+ antiporter complex subunit F [Defluviitaleaceae bacterium]|nr:monovalent cation/H+ antiporter complex subunit F [Defluviitaleaceae bacterium]
MFVLWAMLGLLTLYVIRAAIGPSIWDRLLAMNLIATKTIIIIIAYASVEGLAFLIDFAIIYALFGFIGTIFIALFLSEHRLGKRRRGK